MLLWDHFVTGLKEGNRHFTLDGAYFNELVAACLSCGYTLMRGHELYRARVMPLDKEIDTEPLPGNAMTSPPPEVASAGRLNPDGIPYFYAALDPETAIAEVRPWVGGRLTVAKFVTAKAYDVLDLTGVYTARFPSLRVQTLSHIIGRPAHRDDRWAYLGTQYVAERLKDQGIHGILYTSSMRPAGTNVALFSDIGVLPTARVLHHVRGVTYDVATLTTHSDG
jgi:RES domain-containing protein